MPSPRGWFSHRFRMLHAGVNSRPPVNKRSVQAGCRFPFFLIWISGGRGDGNFIGNYDV